ncbi:hypothetical protein J2Z21_009270 [Streptomyces griseochromogenes]|uniref:Uncharacterized protein n=1 Tax=Streptomyces griseochromogenes TaxID=68214 RepID=A0A1B1AZV5_9ACTN|nr:hypothetical protein [Streptomyces griseochromogenes]ANP52042.1 hypothetical protein AVL59_22900 [Streptomyces griseochromogenes]MBP2056252.1 hypothetical protein [Streptomyces griseochromogenes]
MSLRRSGRSPPRRSHTADTGHRTWCTGQRFAAYRALLGDAFDGRVLPDSAASPAPPPFFADLVGTPHSVVTAHLDDKAGHPTVRARDEILVFLTDRLHPHRNRPLTAT